METKPALCNWWQAIYFEDFSGNKMINTLGKTAQYPFCGMLVLDFESGDIIQLAAKAFIEEYTEARLIRLEVLSTR
jgi:hypothetical protein